MLATWWHHNMHGRRLVGHLAQLALFVILIVAIGGSAEFGGSRDWIILASFPAALVIGSTIEAIRQRSRQAAVRVLASIVIGSLFVIGVLAVDTYVERSSGGWPMSALMTPALMLVVVILAGAGSYLTEDDEAKRPRTILAVAACGFVSFATFLSTSGGPLEQIGVAMLLIAAAGIVVTIVYVLARTPPAFSGPGT